MKLLALVGLGLIAALLCAAVGLVGISRTHASVVSLDKRSVQPLAALGSLRDAQGDSRVNVWSYLATGADRSAVADDMASSDQAVQDAVSAFFTAHGSHTDANGTLMTQFATAFTAWTKVRDTVVRPAADAGRSAAAYRALAGPLKTANEAMAAPMDTLYQKEVEAADQTAAEAGRSYRMVRIGLFTVLLISLPGALVTATWMTRRILASVALVRTALDRLAAGDLTEHPLPPAGGDELAQMGRATSAAGAGMRTVVRRLASGVSTLDDAVERLRTSSATMGDASSTAADQAEGASTAVSQVNTSVQTVAVGTEQMKDAIQEIASNSQEAARVAQEAARTASSTDEQVRRLGVSSTEIMSIVNVITSIAGQTNMLALNATIEAARAGAAGKGFAVVANEVKELATETARATQDISHRVETIQAETTNVVTAIAQIISVIEQINDLQTSVAGAVEEQSVTVAEINRNVGDAAMGSSQILTRVEAVADATRQTNTGVATTTSSAQELANLSAELRSAIALFRT